MRRWILVAAAAMALGGSAGAQQGDPPHAWVFGSWTGGIYPPGQTSGPSCTGQPAVIFTKDVVLRASVFDVAYRQRLIETVATSPDVLEFRFVPVTGPSGPLASRTPPDIGFGCVTGPNTLRVERRGPNEIVFPNCAEFPSPLQRCVGN
ncbi:hypothetical protein [Falsiroseomonas tokyonensis]|uniref:Uncharacterized protein n=1 Tax=Falsiroseomonas tokyonensis TaxID=430521 RepID=A0ABV7BWR4_9PROT|nr:hypothetical protein [Falsiroseomonas tokyonensis]